MMISCHDLSFSYPGGPRILSDLNFDVEKGESIAILGANGSGKSTLLRLISTLLPVSEGHLSVDGIEPLNESCRRKMRSRIAYVFQNPDSCFVSDTVIDDAMFTPLNYGNSKEVAESMAMDALCRFGIADKRNRLISTLSGGEKERAILASVSSMDKDIYLFDEVLTFLDGNARDTMLSLIADLKKDGKTILFVTQSSDEALFFEKTLLITGGRIAAFGDTEEILRDTSLLEEAGVRLTRASRIAVDLGKAGLSLSGMPIGKEELCSLLKM